MLMSFKLLTGKKGKCRNVKFPSTWLIMAVRAFIYLLTISVRILFMTSTIIKCHTGLLQWNTATVLTVATAYPSSQLHPPRDSLLIHVSAIKKVCCIHHKTTGILSESW